MVAMKVKKSLALVPASVTIRESVGGKSAMQNEILGDIQVSFLARTHPTRHTHHTQTHIHTHAHSSRGVMRILIYD